VTASGGTNAQEMGAVAARAAIFFENIRGGLNAVARRPQPNETWR